MLCHSELEAELKKQRMKKSLFAVAKRDLVCLYTILNIIF